MPRIAEKTDANKLYETVGTMNDSWGYRPTDTHYKSIKSVIGHYACDVLILL